jgi:hypothetical protein
MDADRRLLLLFRREYLAASASTAQSLALPSAAYLARSDIQNFLVENVLRPVLCDAAVVCRRNVWKRIIASIELALPAGDLSPSNPLRQP